MEKLPSPRNQMKSPINNVVLEPLPVKPTYKVAEVLTIDIDPELKKQFSELSEIKRKNHKKMQAYLNKLKEIKSLEKEKLRNVKQYALVSNLQRKAEESKHLRELKIINNNQRKAYLNNEKKRAEELVREQKQFMQYLNKKKQKMLAAKENEVQQFKKEVQSQLNMRKTFDESILQNVKDYADDLRSSHEMTMQEYKSKKDKINKKLYGQRKNSMENNEKLVHELKEEEIEAKKQAAESIRSSLVDSTMVRNTVLKNNMEKAKDALQKAIEAEKMRMKYFAEGISSLKQQEKVLEVEVAHSRSATRNFNISQLNFSATSNSIIKE